MKITIELDTMEPRVAEIAAAFLQMLAAPAQQVKVGSQQTFAPEVAPTIAPTHKPAPETTTTDLIGRATPNIGTGSAAKPTQPVEEDPFVHPLIKNFPPSDPPSDPPVTEANKALGHPWTPLNERFYTLEEVRATLAALNKAGKRAQVKTLLQEFGTEKLTEVDPGYFTELMKKAAAL